MRRTRLSCALVVLLTLSLSVSMTSCGGGGDSGGTDLVLLGFSFPDVSGIALNEPLVFTFSAAVAAESITLDTLRVVGAIGPFFEETVVDGNLVALVPRSPNFESYEDAGLAPGVKYSVSMPVFPAVDTIETPGGKPLLEAESFEFSTLPTATFVEPARAVLHGTPPSSGGRSDDEGCLQNSSNALYTPPNVDPSVIQTGSGPGANLICLRNEGAPHVVNDESFPTHDQRAVGTPSAVNAGLIDMPAIRVKINEPADPLTVVPYEPTTQTPFNIQLWRVAFRDGSAVSPTPDRIATNKPIVVQTSTSAELILVPAGPIQQGIYCINVTSQIKDLPGNPLVISDRPNPAIGGYNVYESAAFNAVVPAGYRIYFRTLEVPNTALAIIEDFNSNLAEWGDLASADTEPGMYSLTVVDVTPPGTLGGNALFDFGGPNPNVQLTYGNPDPVSAFGGQSTTADWNNGAGTGFRFLNILTLPPNPEAIVASRLRANYKPYRGIAADFLGSLGDGSNFALDTDAGSINGDGIFEYKSLNLLASDTMSISGGRPALILVQDDCTIAGNIILNGSKGGPGLDTDGTFLYTNSGAIVTHGAGGTSNGGGGVGGAGASFNTGTFTASDGAIGSNLFGTFDTEVGGAFPGRASRGRVDPTGDNSGSGGGGGGGNGTGGASGLRSNGDFAGDADLSNAGGATGDDLFSRAISLFTPDRGYSPFSNIHGGSGGGGGSPDDDSAGSEVESGGPPDNNDDGGGGGGAAGGGICIICGGNMTIAATGNIQVNGGPGGNTYASADQTTSDPDMDVDDDEFISGVKPGALAGPGTGDGGPGGGGSGGSILLIGSTSLTVDLGATMSAVGGAGGTSGDPVRDGGDGGDGRISLITFGGSPLPANSSVTITPAPFLSTGAADQYWPPVKNASVAQSQWIDLFTPSGVFDPDPDDAGPTPPQMPTFTSNFQDLIDAGVTFGAANQFHAAFEFQGASDLSPPPGGGPPPVSADGITQWEDVTNIANLNGKRYFRWRFRFYVDDTFPFGLQPLPAIINLEIPFEK